MKKITVPFVFLLLCAASLHAQQSARFKLTYKPETNYIQVLKQNAQTKISYTGSAEVLEAMKEKGQDTVMQMNMELTMDSKLAMGKAKKNGDIPVTLEFTNVPTNMGEAAIKPGTKMYGITVPGKMPVYDSIYAPDMEQEEAEKLIGLMSNMLSQINIPDTVMKPGDTYKMLTPLSIPSGMANMDMQIETTYKLNPIRDGIGYFDIEQVYSGSSGTEEISLPLKGNGKGKMEMDIANGFATVYSLDTDMSMDTKFQEMGMTVKSLMHVEVNVKLGKK